VTTAGLFERDADPDPFGQFDRWFREAQGSGGPQPEAMALATTTPDGHPSVRMVLLKGIDRRGLIFYTNAGSQKGRELAGNPRAAVVLYWFELHRQVRVSGTVELLAREETEQYFRTRPRDAQLSALASQQSQVVSSRDELERTVTGLQRRYEGQEVPLPEEWSGMRLVPESFEFWQGRPDRLHDRLRYTPVPGNGWKTERLQP
jgi:pyridoxamine 5'-phosphate oxidase